MGHRFFDCYRELQIVTKFLLALNLDPNLYILYVLLANYFELVLRIKAFKVLVNEKEIALNSTEGHTEVTIGTEKYSVQEYSLKHYILNISKFNILIINLSSSANKDIQDDFYKHVREQDSHILKITFLKLTLNSDHEYKI